MGRNLSRRNYIQLFISRNFYICLKSPLKHNCYFDYSIIWGRQSRWTRSSVRSKKFAGYYPSYIGKAITKPLGRNVPERSSRVSWFKPILTISVDLILVSPSWRSKPPDQAFRLPSIHGSLCSANYFYFRIEGHPDYFNLSFHGRSLSPSCIRVFARYIWQPT